MVEILVTDEWEAWYDHLAEDEQESVRRDVDRLEMVGVSLGHPYSSAIKGSLYALRELRNPA